MEDVRVERMAEIITGYSSKVKRDDLVVIRGGTAAAPLIRAVYAECVRRGAYVHAEVSLPGLEEIFFEHAKRAQLAYLSPMRKFEVENVDVVISILSETNTRRLSGADPKKQAIMSKTRQPIMETFMKRAAEHEEKGKGGLRWTLTLFPTEAYAQDAEMGIREYENFVFGACFADEAGGIKRWREQHRRQARVIRYLKGRKVVEIGAPGTDLRVGIAGRPFMNCSGRNNFPDGEVFTGPQENRIDGKIRYSFPACISGREVDGVELEFEKGEVVKATADKNEAFLKSMIGMDDGAKEGGGVRLRLERRHPALHEKHAVRRENRRHPAPRPGQGLSPEWFEEQLRPALGHGVRFARGRRGVRGRKTLLQERGTTDLTGWMKPDSHRLPRIAAPLSKCYSPRAVSLWAGSSAGRAVPLQGIGRRFEPSPAHQRKDELQPSSDVQQGCFFMSEGDFVIIAHLHYCNIGRGHTNRICESAS